MPDPTRQEIMINALGGLGPSIAPMVNRGQPFVDPMEEKLARDQMVDPRMAEEMRRRKLIEAGAFDEPTTDEGALRLMQAREARKRMIFQRILEDFMRQFSLPRQGE